LAESNYEKIYIEEKLVYESIIKEASNVMLLNYYKMYQDKELKQKELKNLCDYIENCLTPSEISGFITELKETKRLIDKESVDKTEDIFKLFIYKIYNIITNKSN
jgi:hypothetical protein